MLSNWKTFLQAHWVKIAMVLLPIVGAAFGWSIKVNTVPADQPPSVVINVPGEAPEPLVFEGGAEKSKIIGHPLYNAARHIAGRQYARKNGLDNQVGIGLAFAVPDDHITAAAKASGMGDIPTVQGPLIDWLKAHPEAVQMIIKIILELIPLFADGHQPPAILPIPPPITVARLPWPTTIEPVPWILAV